MGDLAARAEPVVQAVVRIAAKSNAALARLQAPPLLVLERDRMPEIFVMIFASP
jgi:hypothetical protein